jgi:hypothetical protein
MTGAEKLAERITQLLPQTDIRAIRLWGCWTGGKAWDEWHRLIRCEAEGDMLHMDFGSGEALFVWAPRRAVVDETVFRIGDADRLRWEWYAYGGPDSLANCHSFEFVRTPSGVEWTRDAGEWQRVLHPPVGQPAVELLSVDDLRRSPE